MISLQFGLYIFIVLITADSGGLPLTDKNEGSSQIKINKNFKKSIHTALSSEPQYLVPNFVHQVGNFFISPQLPLETLVPPQNKENITVTAKTEETEVPEITEANGIISAHFSSNIINESLVFRLPFPPQILFYDSIPTLPPRSSLLIPIEIPVIPENIDIPPAPILPPLELTKIIKIIEEPVETFPQRNDPEILIPKVITLHSVEPEQRILEKTLINIVPKQLTMKILQFPAALQIPSSVILDNTDFSHKEETVVLFSPIPEIPDLLSPTYSTEPIFFETIVDPPIPIAYAQNIIVEHMLPNIVISKNDFTKSVEMITIPKAENSEPTASVFPKNVVDS